ncbi:MAG TPA: HAMP domain-containing sensor histidine kinase, partial [Aggregatilineales bacterium]|nr:HAMP domain-containing sensor histidine kinase [Aggregatilineales bacterium]
LRTPLTTIQGNLDIIRLYGNDPKSVEAIKGEVQRMTRMVDDLLLLAQADSGQIPVETEELELDQLLLEIYNVAGILSKGKYKLKLGDFDQVRISGNADRLKQLFLNLTTNAIKYTPEGGTITISLKQVNDRVHASVSDTGVGIPAEDLEHIFNRFYRVDKARSRDEGGSGLGLSIAKWIAEVHQGSIKVNSKEGAGTTFTVILPIKPDKTATEPNTPPEPRSRFAPIRLS